MSPDGQIYHFWNHPDKEALIEELDLVEVPLEEYGRVANMSETDRRAWYREQKNVAV